MINVDQQMEFPWERPRKSYRIQKSHHFYKNERNIWNNPYVSSKKIAKYFHEPCQTYALNNPSDNDKIALENQKNEMNKRREHLCTRHTERERLQTRTTERELLQNASLQKITEYTNKDVLKDISIQQPQLATELILKKSITFKDPKVLSFSNGQTQ